MQNMSYRERERERGQSITSRLFLFAPSFFRQRNILKTWIEHVFNQRTIKETIRIISESLKNLQNSFDKITYDCYRQKEELFKLKENRRMNVNFARSMHKNFTSATKCQKLTRHTQIKKKRMSLTINHNSWATTCTIISKKENPKKLRSRKFSDTSRREASMCDTRADTQRAEEEKSLVCILNMDFNYNDRSVT